MKNALYVRLFRSAFLSITLLSSVMVYAETKTLQPVETVLLFQALTLTPGKIARIDTSGMIEKSHENSSILVKTDRKISLLKLDQHPARTHVLLDEKEKAKFQVFIYTNQGRTLTTKAMHQKYLSQTENQDMDNQIIFMTDLALGKSESINALGFLCDKKVTIFRVVWLDDFPK